MTMPEYLGGSRARGVGEGGEEAGAFWSIVAFTWS